MLTLCKKIFSVCSLLISIILLLNGCAAITGGKDNTPAPNAVPKIVFQTKLKKVWGKYGFGNKTKNLYLNLYPLVKDDYVYYVNGNQVVSLVAQTGKLHWSKKYNYVFSSSFGYSNNALYVGTDKGVVLAISQKTGDILWSKQLTGSILSAPVYYRGVVYAYSIDGMITAINDKNQRTIWNVDITTPELSLRGASKPIIADGKLIVGFASGSVIAFNLYDGSEEWTYTVSQPKGNTIVDKIVNIDSKILRDGNTIYVVSYNGNLAALNVSSGYLEWEYPLSAYKDMAQDSHNIYIINDKSEIIAISKNDGYLHWKNNFLLYRNLTAPLVINNYLIIGDSLGYLFVVNKINGKLISYASIDRGAILGLASSKTGAVLALTSSGNLWAYQVL